MQKHLIFNFNSSKQKGVIMILAILTMALLFILGAYFLSSATTETKISKSNQLSNQSYYLAEAGANEIIWKLQNDHTTTDGDPAFADDFIDPAKNPYPAGQYWSADFTHSFAGGTYSVAIQNTEKGKGDIIVTANLPAGDGKTSKRVIKAGVLRAVGHPTEDSAILSGGASGNISFLFGTFNIYKGNLFSDNNLQIDSSKITLYDNSQTEDILEGQVLAKNNYLFSDPYGGHPVVSTAKCAKNICTSSCEGYVQGINSCPPEQADVPAVDFDSSSPNSFKSRAQATQDLGQCSILCNDSQCSNKCILTASQFDDLIWQAGYNGTLTLNNKITYVTGGINLRGGRKLVVNGVLLADDNISLGENYNFTRNGKTDWGYNGIVVNRPSTSSPSGILAKRKLTLGFFMGFPVFGTTNINGIIYACDEIRFSTIVQGIDITGGIIGRKMQFGLSTMTYNITLDNDIISYGLGYIIDGQPVSPYSSPTIMIDHWEESY